MTVVLTAKNDSTETRHISVVMCAMARYYTGVSAEELGETTMELDLEPGEQKDAEWFCEGVKFICLLDEDATIGFYVTAFVRETEQVFTTQKVIDFDKPDLEMEVSSNRVNIGQQFEVVIRFTNPLDLTLTKCVVNLEGPGIQDDLNIQLHRSIKPGETMSQKVKLTPKYRGKRELIANFHSERLVGITGSVVVDVV
ncbi:hypothetical protein LSAT2_017573 [Lamellibrachia satsuma]|nr:hypothetical protein LSAT2_017573 [Lamellibrachia satsuma]